jgi:hypothetical protein
MANVLNEHRIASSLLHNVVQEQQTLEGGRPLHPPHQALIPPHLTPTKHFIPRKKTLGTHNMSSPLLLLPAELRNRIYFFALTTPTGDLTFNTSRRRFNVSSIGAGLLTACRSLYSETRYLPLQSNRLVFELPSRCVWFTHLLTRLNKLEEDMGWIVKMEVKFSDGFGRDQMV